MILKRRIQSAIWSGALVCMILTGIGGTAFAQVAADPTGLTPEQREQRLISFSQRELTLELIRIGTLFDVSDDVRSQLHALGKPIAESIGKNRAKDEKLPTFVLRNFPGESLSSVLSKELKRRLGDEPAKRYEKDVRTRIAFFDQAYSGILLVMLDQQVGLTSEQVPAAIAEIKKLPRFRYTHPHIHSFDWTWGITPPAEFLEHDFACLSDPQTTSWMKRKTLLKQLPKITAGEIAEAALEPVPQPMYQHPDVLRDRCREALNLKVEILTEQYNLELSQVAKLRLLAKRVTTMLPKTVHKAGERQETLAVGPDGGRGKLSGGWAVPLSERIPVFELLRMTDLFDLIESRSGWRKFVSGVLTEGQRMTFEKRHSERIIHNHNAYWRCWVVTYSLRLGLTAQQEQALFDLVSRSIKPDPTATRVSHTSGHQPGAIPREAFVKAIGEEHTADLDARLLKALRVLRVEDEKMGE